MSPRIPPPLEVARDDRKVTEISESPLHRLNPFFGRGRLTVALVALILLVYGFELFSFNLTIDEEIHAHSFDPELWVSQGRWAMYLLTRFALPYTEVPVIPLAIGLVFHLAGTMLLLTDWEVEGTTTQFLVGAMAIATPTAAYMYTFDTLSFGLGMGVFLSALSLALFRRMSGSKRYLAAVPAALALGTYQAFALVLVTIFAIAQVRSFAAGRRDHARNLLRMVAIGIAAALGYVVAQALFKGILDEPASAYVEQFIDFGALGDPGAVIEGISSIATSVYSGSDTVYARAVPLLPILIVVLTLGLLWRSGQPDRTWPRRLLLILCGVGVLLVPFLGRAASAGAVPVRSLIAVPFALAGLVALGMPSKRQVRLGVSVLAALVLLQFAIATNSLFGSSHLALQQDRSLGTRLIERIELEMRTAAVTPQYLEIVGRPTRVETLLVPQSETFGASFFEWDGGSVYRSLFFLETLGFTGLQGLPADRRGNLSGLTSAMPYFPAPGSVTTAGDVVIVKFGPYTPAQISAICATDPKTRLCL